MAEITQNNIWYNVNFSNDLYFNGRNTRFLRIAIPPRIDNADLNNEPDPRKYWITLIPVLSFKEGNNENLFKQPGTPSSILSQYRINGINAKDVYDEVYASRITYDCFNLYGDSTNLHEDLRDFMGGSDNSFTFAHPKHWEQLKDGDTYEYRIDYLGEEDELIKFIFFISEFAPIEGSFGQPNIFQHGWINWQANSILQTTPPIPDPTPSGWMGYPQLENGVKTINHHLCGGGNFNNVSEDTVAPYYAYPKLLFRIDFIDLDIYGLKYTKKDHKVNVSLLPNDEKIVYDDLTSHMLIRTNPMLSGNIKLTTDSLGDIWLNSIDANDELSNSRFKKFKLSPYSSYSADVYKFLDYGTVPSEVLYDISQYDDSYQYTKNVYNLEYDNFYGCGVSQLNSKFYDEEFSFFAPLWLKRQIPEFFVIFKSDHPLSIKSYSDLGNIEITKDVIENSMIVKTFDMREGSKLGKYLRKIVAGNRFKEQPLYVSFDEDSLSTWNGISYVDGSVTEKGEYLYDIFNKDRPIKEFEDYITSGFKRNKIICQNLVNLEFLFNDTVSDEYTINRYFGMYVNEIELDKFTISDKVLYQLNEQTPKTRLGVDAEEYSMTTFNQTNANGIVIPVTSSINHKLEVNNDSQNILSSIIANKERFFVLKNRASELKRIKSIENKNINQLVESIDYKEIRLCDTTADISQFTGIDRFSSQLKADLLSESSAQIVLNLYDTNSDSYVFNPGEVITISWARNNEFHKWEMIANETGLQSGDWWDYPVYNPDTFVFQNTFNPKGTPTQVAIALAGCLNQFNDNYFEACSKDNKVYIRIIHKYDGGNGYKIRRDFVDYSIAENMKLYDVTPELQGSIPNQYYEYNFVGGNSRIRNRAKIEIINGSNVEANDWFQCQSLKYSKVKEFNVGLENVHILPYLDEPIYNVNDLLIGFKDIDKYVIIELSDEFEFYTSNEKYITAYKLFMPSFSVLSCLPIKDFDFDFFYSEYAYSPVAELLKYFDFYEMDTDDILELPTNEFFKCIQGSGTLQGYINDTWVDVVNFDSAIKINESFNTIPHVVEWDSDKRCYVFVATYTKFRMFRNTTNLLKVVRFLYSENSISIDSNSYERITKNLLDVDIIDFPGFAGLTDIYTDVDETFVTKYKLNEDFRRFTFPLLNSEYDRLLENNLKEFVLKSRVVPYINKWVNLGTDIRDNKYRLNLSNAFGITGFSPSSDSLSEPSLFTHEWYYLDRHPENYPSELMSNSRSYMFAKLDECPITNDLAYIGKTWKDLLYETGDVDFFTKYFSIGYPNDINDDLQIYRKREERFVFTEHIKGLDEIQCLFRGARFRIKELDAFGNDVKSSLKYKDYRFVSILTLIQENDLTYTEPYKIEIIDNRKFKTMTFVISVFLQDYKFNNFLSYVSLYNSKNSLKNDTVFVNDYNFDMDNIPLYASPLYNLQYDYAKRLGLNSFNVLNDYKDVEIMTNLTKTGIYKFKIDEYRKEALGFTNDEFEKINAGNLFIPFSLIKYNPYGQNFYYGKIVSFEGFLSLINQVYIGSPSFQSTNLEDTYPSIVKTWTDVFDMHTPTQHVNIAEVCRFNPFYIDDIILNGNVINVVNNAALQNFYSKGVYYEYGKNLVDAVNPPYIPSINNIHKLQNFMLNGGRYFNNNIIENISFHEIQSKINSKDSLIKYITINEDNSISSNLFLLEFIEPATIIKSNILRASPDEDKPTELKNETTIGYVLENVDTYEKLQRYNGNFEPKTKDIFNFTLNEDLDMLNYFEKDFILLNTCLNINNAGNAIIKNLSINKVNTEEILKVTNNLAYFNVYPLVNQIAIDNKDHNVLLSSWDNKFYREYLKKDKFIEHEGLIDMKEFKTFFGSKVMNVPNAHDLDSFSTDEYSYRYIVPTGTNVNPLSSNVNSNTQSADNGKPILEITVDLSKRVIRKFFDENIDKEFKWVRSNVTSSFSSMTDEELKIITNDYINQNIINLYEIDSVTIYSKIETRLTPVTNILNVNSPERYFAIDFSKSESLILNSSYQVDKTVKFEKDTLNPLKVIINIELDTNVFKSFSLTSKIKRI